MSFKILLSDFTRKKYSPTMIKNLQPKLTKIATKALNAEFMQVIAA